MRSPAQIFSACSRSIGFPTNSNVARNLPTVRLAMDDIGRVLVLRKPVRPIIAGDN